MACDVTIKAEGEATALARCTCATLAVGYDGYFLVAQQCTPAHAQSKVGRVGMYMLVTYCECACCTCVLAGLAAPWPPAAGTGTQEVSGCEPSPYLAVSCHQCLCCVQLQVNGSQCKPTSSSTDNQQTLLTCLGMSCRRCRTLVGCMPGCCSGWGRGPSGRQGPCPRQTLQAAAAGSAKAFDENVYILCN
jgi:hypothetical protein